MKKGKTSFSWLISGPLLLFLSLVLVLIKTAPVMVSPVWFFGFGIALLTSCVICYLSYQELRAMQKGMQKREEQQTHRTEEIRGVLDEAQVIYRMKIDQLERIIKDLEAAKGETGREREEALAAAQAAREDSLLEASKAHAFHESLQESLDALRELRQIHYFMQEGKKHIPLDLVQQHRQLRQQFEEKSMVLSQTRRRLFTLEGELLAMKKGMGLEKVDENPVEQKLLDMIQKLTDENTQLEEEVSALEEIVSQRVAKKPSAKKKAVEQTLDLGL